MRVLSVERLASLRDLRARILEAAMISQEAGSGVVTLRLLSPRLHESTIKSIWNRAISVLVPSVRERLAIEISFGEPAQPPMQKRRKPAAESPSIDYIYEILRLLLNGVLGEGRNLFTPGSIQEAVGASAPTVRRVLRSLADTGVIQLAPRGAVRPLRIPPAPWIDLLARLGAAPFILRYSYRESGRDMRALLHRTETHMQKYPEVAMSGIAAALPYQPSLDLVGLPRLDLIANASPALIDEFVDRLDPHLKPETNPLAPAAIAITLTCARLPRFPTSGGLRTGGRGDIVLALEDARLFDLAHTFAYRDHRWP